MRKALLVRRVGAIPKGLRSKVFAGWDIHGLFDRTLLGSRYDVIVVGFEEQTQRELEWVDDARTALNRGGKFIRLT